jgi:hypothetical protein
VKVAHQTLIVPVSTLMFRQEGLRVVTVVNGDTAKLVPITIGQDDGRVVQVMEGLQADDEVVQSPPDSVVDGEKVRVVQPNTGGVPGAPRQGSQGAEGGND